MSEDGTISQRGIHYHHSNPNIVADTRFCKKVNETKILAFYSSVKILLMVPVSIEVIGHLGLKVDHTILLSSG